MFEPGRIYKRAELHQEWGGTTEVQRQGGILTPREAPLVIVVTGEEGRQFGYADCWDDEGVFHYFGAGQDGDMDAPSSAGPRSRSTSGSSSSEERCPRVAPR